MIRKFTRQQIAVIEYLKSVPGCISTTVNISEALRTSSESVRATSKHLEKTGVLVKRRTMGRKCVELELADHNINPTPNLAQQVLKALSKRAMTVSEAAEELGVDKKKMVETFNNLAHRDKIYPKGFGPRTGSRGPTPMRWSS